MDLFYRTTLGKIILGDSLEVMDAYPDQSVDLIVTSPPFALIRKKDYGNEDEVNYIQWFRSFGERFKRILKTNGSLIIDIGGSWIPGLPARSLYPWRLLFMLCDELGFYLAQDYYWWNPTKLPSPIEWVNKRRIRVKDAVNLVYWLSPSPWPKASNKRVLQSYAENTKKVRENPYKPKLRPSGHDVTHIDNFIRENKGSIPPNLLAIANNESNSKYLSYCKENNIKPHPARFPKDFPEYFIRMLTDEGDFVLDPFAGSCTTGSVCEALKRRWCCIELEKSYLEGALGRFQEALDLSKFKPVVYNIPKPDYSLSDESEPLDMNGGQRVVDETSKTN